MTDFAEKPWFDVFDDYTGVHRALTPGRVRVNPVAGIALTALLGSPVVVSQLADHLPEVAAPPRIVVTPGIETPQPGGPARPGSPQRGGPDTRRRPARTPPRPK